MYRVGVRFVFRKYQGKKKELMDFGKIYAVIGVNKEESEPFSVGEAVFAKNWHGTKLLSDDEALNDRLDRMRDRVKTVASMLDLQGEEVTAVSVYALYLQSVRGQRVEVWTVMVAFDKYIDQQRSKVCDSTLRGFETRKRYLGRWLEVAGRKNMLVRDFGMKEAEGFLRWSNGIGTGVDFASKVLQILKSVLKYAEGHEQPIRSDFMNRRLEWSKIKEPIFITDSDIEKIQKTELRPHYERAFDAWLFARHSGLHFVDYWGLRNEHLVEGCIVKDRQKTGVRQTIPLGEVALGLIQKYGGIEGLPRVSVRSHTVALGLVNRYLADICAMSGVAKFTFSNARDTFLHELYNIKGVRPETENSIAGWTSQREGRRYRRATIETIKKELGIG